VLIPFAAWPLYEVFVTLEDWLDSQPPSAERPIVGKATEEEFTKRVTTFLLGPLLAADEELGGLESEREIVPIIPGDNERPEEWARMLRALGEMWQRAISGVLAQARQALQTNARDA
jgi:hypothetical protein